MRKIYGALAMFALLVGSQASVGCAGLGAAYILDKIDDGGGSNDNDFEGRYSGTFTTQDGQTGTVALRVDDDGDFDGTGRNNTLNADFEMSGRLNDDGRVLDGELTIADVTYDLEGDFDRADGTVTGSVTQSNGDQTSSLEFNLARE